MLLERIKQFFQDSRIARNDYSDADDISEELQIILQRSSDLELLNYLQRNAHKNRLDIEKLINLTILSHIIRLLSKYLNEKLPSSKLVEEFSNTYEELQEMEFEFEFEDEGFEAFYARLQYFSDNQLALEEEPLLISDHELREVVRVEYQRLVKLWSAIFG